MVCYEILQAKHNVKTRGLWLLGNTERGCFDEVSEGQWSTICGVDES